MGMNDDIQVLRTAVKQARKRVGFLSLYATGLARTVDKFEKGESVTVQEMQTLASELRAHGQTGEVRR